MTRENYLKRVSVLEKCGGNHIIKLKKKIERVDYEKKLVNKCNSRLGITGRKNVNQIILLSIGRHMGDHRVWLKRNDRKKALLDGHVVN